MTQSIFKDAAWFRAATLSERIASRSARVHSHQIDQREAERRMSRWRSQPPFTNASVLAQRLACDGINEDQFLDLLGESPECIRACFSGLPTWLVELTETFSHGPSPGAIPFPEATSAQLFSLLNSIGPLIAHSFGQLHNRIQQVLETLPEAPVDSETIAPILFADLARRLLAMLSRTLVLELNVARLEGLLDGDTPEDRFQSFLRRVRQPQIALAMLHQYPVLARQLTLCLNQWVACSLEFLERLCADWVLIRSTFASDENPGVLVHLRTDAGDRHRSGRSVSIAKFLSGFQLVYKPKSMAVDAHFQELLTWMNQRGADPGFRTLKILDRDTHGWTEFVAAEACDSLPALRRFYECQGAYLALLYLLEATDFHCDNVIAAGQHPVLIDLEATFQPRCMVPPADNEKADSTTINHSVLAVGLLPQRDWANAESEGVDFSGLGGAGGQITPYSVPDWENAGTDVMCLRRRRFEMPVANNRPSFNGQDVNPADYVTEIVAGFTRVYRLLLDHRDELLAASGPVTRFADDEVRAVLRPTRTYSVLLQESFHPDVLRDALDRDLLFDRLWVAVEKYPHLARVIQAEREDLQRGDIPIFATRPCSPDLRTSSGQLVKDFFEQPALALVQDRLRQLSERDLELQLWMIRASLATSAPGHTDGELRSPSKRNGSQASVDRDHLLRAARTVGDRLDSVAIRAHRGASWIGLMLEDERHWSIAPLTLDLYDGLPGITLFLAYLGDITGERRYTDLAHDACATMLRRSDECRSFVTAIGGFDGWGGVIYTLAHLGALWHAPELSSEAEAIVARLPPWIEEDKQFDVLGGAAGCIASLIALDHQLRSQRTLCAATACGEHLVAHMQRTEHGVGWTIPQERTPLSGFAHGGAGVAWALLKLAALTGAERFHTTALAAIAHERSLFSPEVGNWRDLRVPATTDSRVRDNREPFMTAWCNGAPGIGLARLSTLPQLDDLDVRREIETALHTTLNHGFGRTHSLCHGDLGNLELLLQAGQVLERPLWHAVAYRLAAPAVESVSRNEYLCGTPFSVDSPGLMTGLAGIGYGLLRLAEPARVPSVLTLQPPLEN